MRLSILHKRKCVHLERVGSCDISEHSIITDKSGRHRFLSYFERIEQTNSCSLILVIINNVLNLSLHIQTFSGKLNTKLLVSAEPIDIVHQFYSELTRVEHIIARWVNPRINSCKTV